MIMFDKTGNAATFFRYKARLVEFQKHILALKMGKSEMPEALEALRSQLVYTMGVGERLCIYLDKMCPDFKTEYTNSVEFPSEEVFNFAEWRKKTSYMKVVKEEENQSPMKVRGQYELNPKFQIIVLASYHSDEDMQKVVDSIPHGDKMAKYVIS